jgi:hypothetical protein
MVDEDDDGVGQLHDNNKEGDEDFAWGTGSVVYVMICRPSGQRGR